MIGDKSEESQAMEEEIVNAAQIVTSGRPNIHPEKKRKRSEDEQEEKEEEDAEEDDECDIRNGEKIFTKSKTGRKHYLEVIKKLQHIKGLPTSALASMMTELFCEIKRRSSKNINGTVTRKMREYLICLYHTLEEIKKEDRIISVEKEFGELKKENQKLREELENIKRRLNTPRIVRDQRSTFTQTSDKKKEIETYETGLKRNDKGLEKKLKSASKNKRNLPPEIDTVDKKRKDKNTKRKLSYTLENTKESSETEN